ncbi:MAG: hypothetical protein AAGA90_12205 [Actinomycetota bacterium]
MSGLHRLDPRTWAVHHRIAALVGLFYFGANLVIFRDVVTALPAILDGRSVINGDELVPYFNPRSQLLDQAAGEFNQLTHGYEFRVRYSFLTTWVRHYKILPFAILLFLPAIVYTAYLTVVWFLGRVVTSISRTTLTLAAAFPTGFVYLIMTYAKITHFYTLVAGLCMFMISSLVMLDALLFRRWRWRRRMLLACLVTLLNPAVHYLILFGLFLALTLTTLALGEIARAIRTGHILRVRAALRPSNVWHAVAQPWRLRRMWSMLVHSQDTTLGRCVTAGALFLFTTLIPYALFVKFVALRGVDNLSETVPGDYYFIRDASVSLVHILSWDLAGIMDKIKFGDYLAKTPRVPNMLYTLAAFAPLAIKPIRRSLFPTRAHRQLLGVIYVNVIFAIWATVGYGNPSWFPTFHRSMAATTRAMYATDSAAGDLTLTLASTIVQVLRFPHRFQLILFMLAPVLLTLPLAWVIERANRRWGSTRQPVFGAESRSSIITRIALTLAIGSVFFLPFLSNSNYREVFTSGNFGHFATAYPVDELKEVKDVLEQYPSGKTVVLPPTETSKLVVDPNGAPHKFIDKFYIYYLDQPSFYYGLTGDSANKFEFFLILRAMYYQQDWWINVARDIDLEYIVLNKQIENNRGVGAEYLPDIELYLREQIEAQPDHVEQLFENDSFVLYRLDIEKEPEREVLLIDTSWKDFLDLVFARLDLSRCYDFQYISNYDPPPDGRTVNVVATARDEAGIDMWAAANEDHFFIPSHKMFAFNPEVVSSSYYLSPMFRLFLFFSDTKWNRAEMITPGVFGTLRGSFIGVPRDTGFTVPTVVDEPGRYRVLLRTAATGNLLDVSAPSLGFEESFEVRSPADALTMFERTEVYESDREPWVASDLSVTQLEERVAEDVVPINLRYVYQDLGTVDIDTPGLHEFDIDKLDDNPMLVEGLLLIPEGTDLTIEGNGGRLIEDYTDLGCSETSDVRNGARDPYLYLAAVENGPHADLTDEQLMELIGLEDLAPPDTGGLGGRWVHLLGTLLVVWGAFRVVRWRARIDDPDETLTPGTESPMLNRDDT